MLMRQQVGIHEQPTCSHALLHAPSSPSCSSWLVCPAPGLQWGQQEKESERFHRLADNHVQVIEEIQAFLLLAQTVRAHVIARDPASCTQIQSEHKALFNVGTHPLEAQGFQNLLEQKLAPPPLLAVKPHLRDSSTIRRRPLPACREGVLSSSS